MPRSCEVQWPSVWGCPAMVALQNTVLPSDNGLLDTMLILKSPEKCCPATVAFLNIVLLSHDGLLETVLILKSLTCCPAILAY